MKRRTFLTACVAASTTARFGFAQQPGEVKRLGWLSTGTVPFVGDNPALTRSATEVAQLFDALKSYGWIEGQNLIVQRRYAGGKTDELPRLAAELVALKVDVIHATSGTAALAAKRATASIPIIALSSDMVGQGLVSNLARPDSNVTGQNLLFTDLAGKRLQLLRETLPRASRIAVFGCGPGTEMGLSWPFVEGANRLLKFQLLQYTPQTLDEITVALQDASTRRADGLLVLDCPRFNSLDRVPLLRHQLPAIYYVETFAWAGGLMSYSPDAYAFFRRSAWYIDRVLRGATPANLPVEQPTQLRLVINLKTAKALGLTIPPSLLLRADQVIE